MQNHLSNSSAAYGSGISPGKRVFKVTSGEYAGRLAILMQTSPSDVKLSYSDYLYTDWSQPESLVNDCADYPFDAVMDDDFNIYLVYTLGSNNDLVCRKLTFWQGYWMVGNLYTIYNGDDNYFPSITIQQPSRLWVSWSRLSSGIYYVNAKHSDDWGETWGNGPSSYGHELSSGVSEAYSKVLASASYVYAIYAQAGTKLSFRRKHVNVALWDDESDIASGSGYDHNFDAAFSDDNCLGVVFDDGKVRFREFDGNSWGGIVDIDDSGGSFPQLMYRASYPYIIYLSDFAAGRRRILYCCKRDGQFGEPEILDRRKAPFDRALCYNSVVAGFSDVTTAAQNSAAGDVYHPDSAVIFKEAGDALYLGMQHKFHYLMIILSTAGSGGNISWQYYNGQEWISFEPSGGGYDFNSLDKGLLLWNDYTSIPSDWQKYNVEDSSLFWVKAVVSSPFSTGPVGTQITAVSDVEAVVLME
ncbi:MAG: hypothetical protein JSU69_09880 [Candidatus Zixiibacteriota bacterium]|nr:MAG: hypothetical protein JSU69_09880 [candidate division Zixibacteria bacterium]